MAVLYGAPFAPKGSIKAINLLDHITTTNEPPSLSRKFDDDDDDDDDESVLFSHD